MSTLAAQVVFEAYGFVNIRTGKHKHIMGRTSAHVWMIVAANPSLHTGMSQRTLHKLGWRAKRVTVTERLGR